MEGMDYWRLCDELSVIQAALLIVGFDPYQSGYIMTWQEHEWPDGFSAAYSALTHAILGGRLPATIRRQAWERGWNEEPIDGEKYAKTVDLFPDQKDFSEEASRPKHRGVVYRAAPDWHLTTVLVTDLQEWLRGRGFKTGFFFPQDEDQPDFLDHNHKNYSPKLAAAIEAWRAINAEPELIKSTVKQALQIWLRKNADRFGLTKEDGSPNEQGIEEVAKVANWGTKGGAPKTPG